MLEEILSLLGLLATVIAVLVLAYFATRFIAHRGGSGFASPSGGRRRLKVLEQLPLGRDQRLVVAQVGQRCFLLGATPSGIAVLAELTGEDAALWQGDGPAGERLPGFQEVILSQLRQKKK